MKSFFYDPKKTLYSFTPIIPTSILIIPPILKIAGGMILGIGALAILGALIEKRLVKHDDSRADIVHGAISSIIILMVSFGVVYVLLHNPLWNL